MFIKKFTPVNIINFKFYTQPFNLKPNFVLNNK